MKIVSWNVNGIRAVLSKGFMDFFNDIDADIFCVQETKCQPGQVEIWTPNHMQYFHSGDRPGYSSTAIFTKQKPLSIKYDIGKEEEHPKEGRVMTFEYENFYMVNAYVPNSKDGLLRLDYRQFWEDDLLKHLQELDKEKPVIYCGDLNVAHNEIDLKNPDTNHFNAGFSDQERAKMTTLLNSGFVDTFRYLYPDRVKYSWWSYRMNARAKDVGWRIDYFIVSQRIADKVKDSIIRNDVYGSDHCPVVLEIDI